ncbi:MAG: 30S ribosomal protein S27e [Candidatus Micrarchaeia archaeon]
MSKFMRVQCECGNDVILFGDSKSDVNCPKCGSPVAKSRGGHAKVLGRVLETL